MTTTLSDANALLFNRYVPIIQEAQSSGTPDPFSDHPRLSLSNLLWMCQTGGDQAAQMPDDKASRWLGFVQGCLAMRMMIDVDEERDVTRPLFHKVHQNRTGETPVTLSRDGT